MTNISRKMALISLLVLVVPSHFYCVINEVVYCRDLKKVKLPNFEVRDDER